MTKIEWADKTWPVVTGCSPVSTGCRHCYAARMAATRLKHHPRYKGLAVMQAPGMPRWTGEVRLNHDVLEQPLRWKKPCMIFVASMGDLFHEDVPEDFVFSVFWRMKLAPQHTFQVLTKRPRRMMGWITQRLVAPLANVWLGVSVENQTTADERIPLLLQTPAAVRFVSLEPMLSAIDIEQYLSHYPILPDIDPGYDGISWVICGGESGSGARSMHPDWARDVRDQCQVAGVPYFHKQNGEWLPGCKELLEEGYGKIWTVCPRDQDDKQPQIMWRVGKKRAGRKLDGQLWEEYPR